MRMLTKAMSRSGFVVFWATALTLTIACSKTNKNKPTENLSGITQPAGKDAKSVAEQLKRVIGRDSFLTMQYKWGNQKGMPEAARAAAGGDGGTAKREIEESDVVKMEGHLVYLLNNYQGVQVVSVKDPEKPVLLARVPPTGNMPEDMFFDESTKTIYILEKYYFQQGDYDYGYLSNRTSRILSYHFNNPEKPEAAQEPVVIQGEARVAQRVGDVLYVAAVSYPNNNYENVVGQVYSYYLKGKKGIDKAAELQLAHPIAYSWNSEPISIQEVDRANDKKAYYLTAKLSKGFWSWGESSNYLQVIDITDPKGAIKTVMLVTAKGTLEEKSQSFIKDDALVVVSNFRSKVSNQLNIAVESFLFPTAKSKGISEKQALSRRLNIELAAEAAGGAAEQLAKEQELLKDPKTGLAGVFVNTKIRDAEEWRKIPAQYVLAKVSPDVLLTIQGGNDGEPSIQDVRTSGKLAFIFWVPPGQKDPLDIVDISNVREKLSRIGRTRFEGFVERSYPVVYKDTQYIVSLGQVTPEENNEARARYPQVRVFEIPKDLRPNAEDNSEAKRIATFTMKSLGNTWINFNGPDKEIPFTMTAEGKGVAMFPYTIWSGKERGAGAEIIGVDFNKRPGEEMISETRLTARNMDWLKRVFKNKTLPLNHSFSDKQFATFSPAEQGGKLLSVLELARDIQAYVVLNKVGVQVIRDYSYESEENGDGTKMVSTVSLRMVDPKRADSPVTAIRGTEAKVNMPLRQTIQSKDALYLIGTSYRHEKQGDGENETWKQFVDVSVARVTVKSDKLSISDVVVVPLESDGQRFRPWFRGGIGLEMSSRLYFLPFYEDVSIIETPSGEIALSTGKQLAVVRVNGDKLSGETLKLSGCSEKAEQLSVGLVSGKFVVSYSLNEGPVPNLEDMEYRRHFFSLAKLDGKELKCEAAINIPGEAKFLLTDNQLITEETFTTYRKVQQDKESKKDRVVEERSQTNLFALELKDGKAILRSPYDSSGVTAENMKQVGAKLLFLEREENYDYGYRAYTGSDTLSVLSLNKDMVFEKQPVALGLSFRPFSVVQVVDEPGAQKGDKLVLLTSYRKGAVLRLNVESDVLVNVKRVSPINVRFEADKPEESFSLLGGAGWNYGRIQSVNFNSDNRSFEFAEGLFGVQQFVVEK